MGVGVVRAVSFKSVYGERLTFIELAMVFLFPLLHMQLYNFVGVPDELRKLLAAAIASFSIIYAAREIFLISYKLNSISFYVKAILFAILLSSLVALYSRGQSLMLSYKIFVMNFVGYVYFFLLYKIKPNYRVIIWLVYTYATIYLLCYIWARMQAPTIAFESYIDNLEKGSRGSYRIVINGLGYVIMLFFFSVVKGVKSWRWYILAAGAYTLIFYSLTRQTMVITLFIAALFLIWKRLWLRIVVILAAAFVLVIQGTSLEVDDSTIVGSLVIMTIKQVQNQRDGEDDIRVNAYKVLLSDFHQNNIETLFGSGYSHVDSKYGLWEFKNFIENRSIRADVGYAGIYVTFGLFGLLIFFALFLKVASAPNLNRTLFAKLFIYYVILANIASWPVRGSCVEICIALYILSIYGQCPKKNIKK